MKTSKRREARILREAAEIIDNRGWIAGQGSSPHGFCALGGVFEVVQPTSLTNELSSVVYIPRFEEHIREKYFRKVWEWNDAMHSEYRQQRINPVTQEMRSFADSLSPAPKPKRIKRIKDLVIAALVR